MTENEDDVNYIPLKLRLSLSPARRLLQLLHVIFRDDVSDGVRVEIRQQL